MADFGIEPPSFSLGLDFDLDLDPGPTPRSEPVSLPAKRPSAVANLPTINEDDDDFESPVRVSVPQASTFKRLRRGPASKPAFESRTADALCNLDDDIENFTSEEDCPRGNLSTHSTCSSSKSSLHGKKVLTSESANQCIYGKKRAFSRTSVYTSEEKNDFNISNVVFPELTISPLRRFQLIDSDSDDSPLSENTIKEVPHVNLSSKKNQPSCTKGASSSKLETKIPLVGKFQTRTGDLWKDLSSEKSSHIPTPAFDEICKEYFSSAKKKTEAENRKDASNHTEWLLPAHFYFFHKDPRIQKLVRDRLPNFYPLGTGNNQDHGQQNASVIDYMGQFCHEGSSSRQTGGRNNVEKSSTRSKKNVKKSQVDVSLDSENWVDPKSCAGLPKDAGKRRVQAASKSAGHWYTGSDGNRVYVSKNGKELTGRVAYMHYKKESGKGFKNSKKQTGTKKKAATKRISAPKKK